MLWFCSVIGTQKVSLAREVCPGGSQAPPGCSLNTAQGPQGAEGAWRVCTGQGLSQYCPGEEGGERMHSRRIMGKN